MTEKYYAQHYSVGNGWTGWHRKWSVYQRTTGGGDRQLATGMGEKTARKVARLLNEDHERHVNAPLAPVDSLHG